LHHTEYALQDNLQPLEEIIDSPVYLCKVTYRFASAILRPQRISIIFASTYPFLYNKSSIKRSQMMVAEIRNVPLPNSVG
jgi:hypothetical protein